MKVTIAESVGHFYLNRTGEQYQAVIRITEDGGQTWGVSCLWDEEDAQDFRNSPPSEVAEAMVTRVNAYLYLSDRDATLAKLRQIIGRADELDAAWASGEIVKAQEQQARAYRRIESMRRAYL